MLTLGLLNPFASSALMTGGVAAMTAASLLGGFTWLGWFALMALPCHALLMLGGALLYLVHRPRHLEGGTAAPQRAARRPLTRDEKVTLVVVVGTTLLWLTDFVHHWSPAVPALGAAVILMIPRIGVLTWADLEKTVSWSTFLATGASLSLAQVLISTGGAAWFARSLLGAISSGPASPVQCVLCVIAVTTVVHLAVPSMSACIALLIPVVTAFAEVAGMNRTPWIRQGSRMVRRDR